MQRRARGLGPPPPWSSVFGTLCTAHGVGRRAFVSPSFSLPLPPPPLPFSDSVRSSSPLPVPFPDEEQAPQSALLPHPSRAFQPAPFSGDASFPRAWERAEALAEPDRVPGFRRPLSCLSPVRSRNLRSFHSPDPARGSRGARRGLGTQETCCASASSQAGLGAALGSGRDWNDADAGRFPDGGGCADFQTTETQSP